MDAVLGLDTSCYTTSAAAVDAQGKVIAFSRLLLPVEAGQRGLRQSEAVFAHVRQLPQVMESLMTELPTEATIRAVCASSKPRDEADSYMPVFQTGCGYGRGIAAALRVPFFETTHQQGHIAAGCIGLPPLDERFLALHLSGGTTELLLCENGRLRLVGGSLDLHAGQMVDRVGVRLGLRFPAGPELEKLAMACADPTEALLPASLEKDACYCHLSGAETRAAQLWEKQVCTPERIAAETFDLLARTVSRMLAAGCKCYQVRQALVVGGVASSKLLRGLLQQRLAKLRCPVEVFFGDPRYSADNAAGVAELGLEQYRQWKEHHA